MTQENLVSHLLLIFFLTAGATFLNIFGLLLIFGGNGLAGAFFTTFSGTLGMVALYQLGEFWK